MSADNGYIVSKLALGEDQRLYGIFDYCASVDEPPSYYTEANALDCFLDPVMAILMAHRREKEWSTEYGVYVHGSVLGDALKGYKP